MSQKLRCKFSYTNQPRGYQLEVGSVLEVDDATAEWLCRDAPGTFEVVEQPVEVEKEMDAPPLTTAFKRPPRSKSMGGPA